MISPSVVRAIADTVLAPRRTSPPIVIVADVAPGAAATTPMPSTTKMSDSTGAEIVALSVSVSVRGCDCDCGEPS